MNINLMKLSLTVAALAALATTGCSSDATDATAPSTQASAPAGQSSEAPTNGGPRGGGGEGGRMPGTFGLIADVQDSTMQVQGDDGQTAVTWTDDTAFTQQTAGSLDDIAVGSCVSGRGETSDDGTVSATQLTVTEPVDGECQSFGMGRQGGGNPPQGMPEGGERPEGAPSGMPSDMPTDLPSGAPSDLPSGGPGGGMTGGAFLSGAVTAIDGETITVESTVPGEDTPLTTTVAISTDITIATTSEASASDVATGLCASAQGETDDTGAVTASSVRLSEPVDGECSFGGMGGGLR
ncbi:DUF5666 domain-containing protein [Tessaracoccus caeni]|uniref:DUF5666 domain-containing protein n=1 Tax=Tessaracoccus caeni TaxID=3031239 RepID=UPI0023D9AEA6|nr:DUF5666 domain-containing protein [Tessaracoccus caeni]MDF1489227.1 DUF5666 domain-containing protein [Tessaracoccus caeni]